MGDINFRRCPVCDSIRTVPLEQINEFVYGRCENCEHVFQITDFGDTFYEKHEYRTQHNYYKHSMDRAMYIANFLGLRTKHEEAPLGGLGLNRKNKDISLLDVGCGRGGVLYYLYDIYDISGVGVNTYPEESYVCKDSQIIGETVFDIEDGIYFDYIIMSHSLEHVTNLNETLTKIRKLLAPNGQLYVEVPHLVFTKQKLNFVFTPEHISYFHKYTIINVLEKNGFEILKYKESTKWSNIKIVSKIGKNKYNIKKENYYWMYFKCVAKYYFYSLFHRYYGPND